MKGLNKYILGMFCVLLLLCIIVAVASRTCCSKETPPIEDTIENCQLDDSIVLYKEIGCFMYFRGRENIQAGVNPYTKESYRGYGHICIDGKDQDFNFVEASFTQRLLYVDYQLVGQKKHSYTIPVKKYNFYKTVWKNGYYYYDAIIDCKYRNKFTISFTGEYRYSGISRFERLYRCFDITIDGVDIHLCQLHNYPI